MTTIDVPAEGVACWACKYYTIDILGLFEVSGTCAKLCPPVTLTAGVWWGTVVIGIIVALFIWGYIVGGPNRWMNKN